MPETFIFKAIDHASSTEELLDILSDFYRTYGFDAVCTVLPKNFDGDEYQLYERGLPEAWIERYKSQNYSETDPIPDFVIRSGRVDTLHEVLEKAPLTEEQESYVREFHASGMTDGLAMPTHGRKRKRGFFGIAQVKDEDLAAVDRSLMHAVAQHAHWRFDQLELGEESGGARLSPRELEILKWIAAGKSNPDIATILGISLPTVATHLKRIFTKLDVSDRVSAALKGQRTGLLDD